MSASTLLPAYEVMGDGKVTVFMLHGAYGDGRYFEDLAQRYVSDGFRVVVWTCPGYGDEKTPDGFGIELAAEYAVRMVEREATDFNVLLGHSMGGLISPKAAVMLPGKVNAVILSASSAGFVNRTEEDQKRYLAERVKPIVEDGLTVREYASGLLKTMMADGAAGDLVDQVYEVVSSMKTEAFLASMRAIAAYDSVPSLTKLSVPTLLIAGESDPACTPAGMRGMHDLVQGSEFYEVKGAGHYAFAEKADEFHSVTTSFIQRHSGQSVAGNS